MGGMSLWHWMIVLVVVLLLFGSGRLSAVMGDAAKGIKAFKKGMADDDTPPSPAHLTQAPPVYSPPPAHVQPATYSPVVEPFAPAGQPLAPAPVMQPATGTEPHRP